MQTGNTTTTPLGGKELCGRIRASVVLYLLPAQKLEMIKNDCVVDCTNFVGKKKGLSFYFYQFPLRDVPDEKLEALPL